MLRPGIDPYDGFGPQPGEFDIDRVGATEFSEPDRRLVTVTQFTTSGGRKFSIQHAFATRREGGKAGLAFAKLCRRCG